MFVETHTDTVRFVERSRTASHRRPCPPRFCVEMLWQNIIGRSFSKEKKNVPSVRLVASPWGIIMCTNYNMWELESHFGGTIKYQIDTKTSMRLVWFLLLEKKHFFFWLAVLRLAVPLVTSLTSFISFDGYVNSKYKRNTIYLMYLQITRCANESCRSLNVNFIPSVIIHVRMKSVTTADFFPSLKVHPQIHTPFSTL